MEQVQSSVKPKRCRVCRREFIPVRPLQSCCQYSCAITYSRGSGDRQSAATKRVQAAEKRETRERLRTRRDWLKLARHAFNAFIRERDRFLPCISCDFYTEIESLGGVFDCGHFRTVGAAPQLRFDEANAHKQCKTCNSGVIREGGRVLVAHDPERAMTIRAAYRTRLIARIGFAEVDRLESDNSIRRYTAEELQAIAKLYRGRLRELLKARAA